MSQLNKDKILKIKNKPYSKFAWPSRVTPPLIKVNLSIQCRNLPKKNLLSQADAFCVLWQVPNGYTANSVKGIPSKLPGRQESEQGRTEIVRASVDPDFPTPFKIDYKFNEEQTYIIRVYDEDLRYATDLKEHDYLGGCVFTMGALMGAKGSTIAKRLGRGKSYMIITGEEIVETREVLEFRFSCQDLIKEQSVIDKSKVLDKSNPYFRVERLNKDDQSWEVVWKSEVVKDSVSPTWRVARLPLQLLCHDNQQNSVKISIWDYEKHSSQHDHMGFFETTVAELVEKAKDTIPVFPVMREKRLLFRGSKLKKVGIFKVIKASVITIPSMLQYLAGGCSLDLMLAIDCTKANGESKTDKSLHFSASHWLNDYQAGIQKLGTILENFARGRHSSMWGFGAKIQDEAKPVFLMAEKINGSKELLTTYDANIVDNADLELDGPGRLFPLIEAAVYRSTRASQKRQCYNILCVLTAGDIADLDECVDLICAASEDAPLSIVMIGVGNRDFSSIEALFGASKVKIRDSRGVPIARDFLHFVSFKQYSGNAGEVVFEALKEIPEQFVQYFLNNGIVPNQPIPPPDFAAQLSKRRSRSRSKGPSRKNGDTMAQSNGF